jgi:hypothetical protein
LLDGTQSPAQNQFDFFTTGVFAGRDPMDYQGFTNDSLVKLYEGVREALAADEAFGGEGRYRVRKTPAWKLHAADLEAEMERRGMTFEVIDWYEADQPVAEMHAPSAGRAVAIANGAREHHRRPASRPRAFRSDQGKVQAAADQDIRPRDLRASQATMIARRGLVFEPFPFR